MANSAPTGEMFAFRAEVATLTGGDFFKGMGDDVVTVDSIDGGLCANVDTPLPSPTSLPAACGVECSVPSDCEAGSTCTQNRCVPAVCTVTGFTCDPNTCLALCPSVSMSNNSPKVGDLVNFQCTTVPGAVRYKFQVIAPSGNISSLESDGPISNAFELTEQGHYDVQCQMCMGAAEDTCLTPQEM